MQIQTEEMRRAMGETDGVVPRRYDAPGRCVSLVTRCVAAPRRMALFVSRLRERPPRTGAVGMSLNVKCQAPLLTERRWYGIF